MVDAPISMSCCCSIDLVAGTLLERLTMGPDITPLLLLLYSMPGRIIGGYPAEPTGLTLVRGMAQSPELPMGDLWGPIALFIGPGKTNNRCVCVSITRVLKDSSVAQS